MGFEMMSDLDLIEELKLRRWAREHYVPRSQRERSWHPIVLEEMEKKDRDLSQGIISYASLV